MKSNISTDRFETVLPDSLRRRYRVPCQKLNAEQSSRNKSSGNSWPSADSDPIKSKGGNGAAIGNTNKFPPLAKPSSPWLIAGGIILFIGLAAIAHIMAGFADKADTMRIATPPLILEATPEPTPQATPTPEAEVRRAHRIARAHMPDGSSLVVTILGAVSRQEELPLSGNSIGDTYYVAGVPFVWTDLSGGGGWLDPAIEIK